MNNAVIGGTGITPFGKFQRVSLRSLTEKAVSQAMSDAKVATKDIDIILFGNAAAGLLTGQECARGQVALRNTGLLGKPIINVENACASSSTAFHQAHMAVSSGQVNVALAIGSEKMSNEDRSKPIKALEAAADLDELAVLKEKISPNGTGSGSVFMDVYSSIARKYMEAAGANAEDFARVSVKQRCYGALNPIAQFKEEIKIQDVLSSRMIADPLTLMMCSSIGDGAAALVIMNQQEAKKRALNYVKIRACEIRSGQGNDENALPVARVASQAAYETASLGPEDLDIIELHDAAAPAELILCEQLGLCNPGDAVSLLRSKRTSLGGDMPINPSGGLISKGHPIGATGAAQLVELADQLRGRSGPRQCARAKIALAENGGGWIGNDTAAAVVTILESNI